MTSNTPGYDVDALRAQFPALADGLAHFDGPGGTQVPASVAAAVAGLLTAGVSNRHGPFPSSARADATVEAARVAVADLVGGEPTGVVLGPSMTTLTMALARALGRTWGPGDEVVVTRLDHDANVRPWVLAAADAGATVRWADVDPGTCELSVQAVAEQVGERTRLVAVTGASNAVGTRPDVRAIADLAHAVGALVHVDGVHLTPHAPVDVRALHADVCSFSPYKVFGPHLGAQVAAPELWETLTPYKLVPSPDEGPERWETGTGQFELYAGLPPMVDLLAGLAPAGAPGDRRARVLAGMAAVEAYEATLLARLLDGLAVLPGVTTYGAPARRTPTVALRVDGHTPREVAEHLGARGVCVWDGNFYAIELVRRLGLAASGGVVRVGCSAYTTAAEVDRLLAELADVAG